MLRAYRRQRGMSQEELANAATLSTRGIAKIEGGRVEVPRPATVRLLADALGLEGADRESFHRAAAGTPSTADMPVPRQLPADVFGFTGRVEQMGRLDAMLADHVDGVPAVVITVIGGIAGVGKTALAVHWAHQVAERFPDGQLYVDLRGFDATAMPTVPAGVVRSLLESLDVPASRMPSTLDAQLGLYRSLLAGRRMLLLLDNARDPEQVRPLLPGGSGCLVLITSRAELSGLVATEGARPLALGLLPDDEARDLLARRLGADRVDAETEAVDEIVRCCAGLPLALAIVAARAATRTDLPLAALAAQLTEPRRLEVLSGPDPATNVRAVFSWSYRTLTVPAAAAFRLIGLHPGPDLSVSAAAALLGVPVKRAWELLGELASRHMLQEQASARYVMHDLLRAYAAELAHTTDSGNDRDAALHRMLEYYLHTAHMANRFILPMRNPIPLSPPREGVPVDTFQTYEHAFQWCAAEHAVLLAVIGSAARREFDTYVWQLARETKASFDIRGLWQDSVRIGQLAVSSAQRSGDPAGQAYAHRLLGVAYYRVGRNADAHDHICQSLELFTATGDARGQAWSHVTLSQLCEKSGDLDAALVHARRAMEGFEAMDDIDGKAQSLNNIGWFHTQRGDHQRALVTCHRALVLYQELGSRTGEASTLHSIGHAHQLLGQHSEAMQYLIKALKTAQTAGDRYLEGWALASIGDSRHAEGDMEAARKAWKEALTVLKDIGYADISQIAAKLTPTTPS